MLKSDIEPFYKLFEVISFSKINNDWLHLKGSFCYQYMPVGNINRSFFRDKIFENDINIFNYITPTKYFAYFTPLTYDLFNRYFNLNDRFIEILENKQINIYEIELIMGGGLKDMGGYRDITSDECYTVNRIDNTRIDIQTPPNLFENNHKVMIILSSYYPNCVYILD